MDLAEHLWQGVEDAVMGIDEVAAQTTYAISFFIYDEDDDPRRPTLTVGVNNEENVSVSTPTASNEEEARWNFAFWSQDGPLLLDSRDDPGGATLRADWIEALDLGYTDADAARDFDAAMERGERLTRQFIELIVQVALRAHDSGLVERAFGRPIPILIHELEYYDEIAEQTARANPPGLADDFTRWVATS